MLRIRAEQLRAFEEQALRRFESKMLEHVKEYFPNHHRVLGEARMRSSIRYAVVRAGAYGGVSERAICCYLNVMLVLGANFDVDPLFPWAGAALRDEGGGPPDRRIGDMASDAMHFVDRFAGEDNRRLNRALLTARRELSRIRSTSRRESLVESAPEHLRRIFPTKFDAVGEENVAEMIRQGAEAVLAHGLREDADKFLYMLIMFALGSGFDRDPQFSWAADVLSEERGRGEKLHAEALRYLDLVLEH
jgi:hypothetical protein